MRVALMKLVESLMRRDTAPPLTRLAQALTLLGHTAASNDQVRQVADRIEELEIALGRTPPKPEAQPAKPKRWAPWARG